MTQTCQKAKQYTPDNKLPLVSVMVVTYNQAHLVKETLDSLLCQDYPCIQVVVADDASTDGTGVILEEYAREHSGIITAILNKKNLGITGNCNKAFDACDGEYIAITGGDDIFFPQKISEQIRDFLADPEVVLSYHPVEIFESDSGQTLYTTNQNPAEDTNNVLEIISKAGIPGASSVMVRRSACPPWGFEPSLKSVSDWIFYIEVAMKGKVVKVDKVLGRYRKHTGGASNRTYELLSESLKTLEIVQERYAGRPGLERACNDGRARYIAGEAIRQLSRSPSIARELIALSLKSHPWNIRFRLIQIVAFLGPLGRWLGTIVNRFKYLIKRQFA